MSARENFGAGTGPGALLVNGLHPRMFARVIGVTRKCGREIGLRASAISHEILAPAIENMAVRIRESVGDVSIKLERARLEAVNARVRAPHRGSPRRLDLRLMKRA